MAKKPEQIIEPIDADFDAVTRAVVGRTKNNHSPSTASTDPDSGIMVVQGVEVHVTSKNEQDYISLTDMARGFEDDDQLIKNWLQNKLTIDFLGVWERLNNPNFNLVEFHQIRSEAGTSRFVMSAKLWRERLQGEGIVAKAGRYGGTFAHKDIAFEFGSWLSPEFKLYLIKEFQRLKEDDVKAGRLEWNLRRSLVKTQYRVHTDAIRDFLIPPQITKKEEGYIYANEADVLNQALFGQTSKAWRERNPETPGNLRDVASVEQLVVLASLESQNALLIEQGMLRPDRLRVLNDLARKQLTSLLTNPSMKRLESKPLIERVGFINPKVDR